MAATVEIPYIEFAISILRGVADRNKDNAPYALGVHNAIEAIHDLHAAANCRTDELHRVAKLLGVEGELTPEKVDAAIRALRAELAVQAKDAERYRSCRYAALADRNDPIINTMRDWPDVTTPEEFDVQADKIVEAMAAQEKANG